MTQQNNTTNWVIQGSNGQSQMIKLVQPAGKSMSGIVTSTVAGQQVKIFKSPTQEAVQVFSATSSPQVIRTITTTPRFVTTKVSGITKATGTKTIRLTPSQVQNFKFVTPQSAPKIQSASNITLPVIHTQPSPATKNASPPILSRKRADPLDLEYLPESKRMRKEKVGKGLRHFSMKVCEKVRKKGKTTYNEVADELVGEFTNSSSNNSLADQYDQKNIRRRVYDALNVLMAMNIISKEKKEIRWIGLPTNSLQECMQLEREKQKKMAIIKEKKKKLEDLIMNQISFKNLVKRNKEVELMNGPPPPNSYVQLPFLIISTKKKTEVDCSISTDKREYVFQFNDKFEIIDDAYVLKAIKMLRGLDTGHCSEEDLAEMRATVPDSLQEYVTQIAFKLQDDLEGILEPEEPGTSTMSSEELVEATLDENSHQSSNDPLSPPSAQDFSDDENESDELSNSDVELSGA